MALAGGGGEHPPPPPGLSKEEMSSHMKEEKAEAWPAQAHSCVNPPSRPEPASKEEGPLAPVQPCNPHTV